MTDHLQNIPARVLRNLGGLSGDVDESDTATPLRLSRRGFIAASVAAGALIIGLPQKFALADPEGGGMQVNPFVALEPDGTVVITASRSEMGQGVRTSLPMIVADELEADWGKVRIVQAIGHKMYGSQNTDGSTSIRQFYAGMREAGAVARTLLEQAAADTWQVPAAEVAARNHAIHHAKTGRHLPYGELVARAKALAVPDATTVTLKSPADFRYIGKEMQIIDLDDMVRGTAEYGIDTHRDGMQFAVIAHPPVVGGRVKSVDTTAALAVDGVSEVVELPALELPAIFKPLGGVAVIASNTWAALKGRAALKIEWDDGANGSYDSDAFMETLVDSVSNPGRVIRNKGNANEAISGSEITIEATYTAPHLPHATMEPPAGIAWFEDDHLQVRAALQDPQDTVGHLASYLEMDAANITVIPTLLGGAFGRKSKPDFALEAAWLSRKVGTPVKVTWSREDDIRHDYYHTIAAQRLSAALDGDGKVTAWRHRADYPTIMSTFNAEALGPMMETGLGMVDVPWQVDNLTCEIGTAAAHVRIGWLRSVANIQQAFAVHSFADELAHKAGRDPKDFLMDLIGSDRMIDPADDGAKYGNYGEPLDKYPIDTARLKNVLNRVSDMAGWGSTLADGRGRGIAVHRSFLSYVGVVLEVEVADDGSYRVPKAFIAVDCGLAVHPDRVRAQMEGAIVFGLSLALYGKLTAKDGRIVEGNFDDFPLLRMPESPEIEVAIIDSEALPTGVGEPGVPPVAPALANAIFAASGKRLRTLPFGTDIV